MDPGGEAFELNRAVTAARDRADFRAAEALARELLALGERTGDKAAQAHGYQHFGVARLRFNDAAGAEKALKAALKLFQETGDRFGASRSMMNLAMIQLAINVDAAAARRLFDAAEPVVRESGDPKRLATMLGNLGEVYRLEGDYEAALRSAQESLRLYLELGDSGHAAWQLTNLAHYHSLLRDHASAIRHLCLAAGQLRVAANPRWTAWYLDVGVIVAAKADRFDVAAPLLGLSDRLRDTENVPRLQVMLPWLSVPIERMSKATSSDELQQLLDSGERLTLDQAHVMIQSLA
jgi:tetratricopeptide (TPR) repeat protein